MRILFLDVNLRYCNPTRELIPRLVSQASDDVTFFGPGYVPSEVLGRGLRTFIAEHGPFDVVIATEHIAFAEDYKGPSVIESYRRNYVFRFPIVDLEQRRQILAVFQTLPALKVVFLLESDYYNFPITLVARLKEYADLLVGWDHGFVRPKAKMLAADAESFSIYANDNWAEFSSEYPERFVPLVAFISDAEFDFSALIHRSSDWCVPGTPYHARRRARAALESSGARLSRGRPLPLGPILTRLGLRPFSHSWFVVNYQELFREEIRRARFAFTCGSTLGFPIRKFFEIPALGTVLVCAPCNNFEALGFRDGENAFISEPEQLPILGRRLNSDLEAAQAVADAGRQLVGECHTLAVRAAQLNNALSLALAGQWRGAVWQSGELTPLSRHSAEQLCNGT